MSACYFHLKAGVDWSQRPPAPNGLSLEERAFVGIYPRPRRNGWHSAGEWARRLDLDPDVDLERVAMFRILVGLGGMDELPSV
jgi:hypothetical protein